MSYQPRYHSIGHVPLAASPSFLKETGANATEMMTPIIGVMLYSLVLSGRQLGRDRLVGTEPIEPNLATKPEEERDAADKRQARVGDAADCLHDAVQKIRVQDESIESLGATDGGQFYQIATAMPSAPMTIKLYFFGSADDVTSHLIIP
jgi:hypothetical protein